jgi:diacylglycerol kinase family enzyme
MLDRPTPRRRLAALAALATFAAALGVAGFAARGDILAIVLVPALLVLACVGAWYGLTRRGAVRAVGIAVVVLSLVAAAGITLGGGSHGLAALAVVVLVGASAAATRYALGRDRRSVREARAPGITVAAPRHAALIINPKSGGGKGERFGLAAEAGRRGIEPILLEPGSDLLALAQDAIDRGADVIGMAGGDGSQAAVASVAMRNDVAHVCIPAGTRNHFALDLGLDREDVVGALDAFSAGAIERRVDLATVGDRIFVNNVALGVYAKIVQSPDYRDAKRQTVAAMLPELLGPGKEPFDLRFTDPAGATYDSVPIVLVSNNPYVLTRLGGFGTRARLDRGLLGITFAEVRSARDVAALASAELAARVGRYAGFHEWTAPTFTIASSEPVEAGIDGEGVVLTAPLEFRSLPGALRVRIPADAPGWSPAALTASSVWWAVSALVRTVAGHSTPIADY